MTLVIKVKVLWLDAIIKGEVSHLVVWETVNGSQRTITVVSLFLLIIIVFICDSCSYVWCLDPCLPFLSMSPTLPVAVPLPVIVPRQQEEERRRRSKGKIEKILYLLLTLTGILLLLPMAAAGVFQNFDCKYAVGRSQIFPNVFVMTTL